MSSEVMCLRQPGLERVIVSTVAPGERRVEVVSVIRQAIAKTFAGDVYAVGHVTTLERKKNEFSRFNLLTQRETLEVSLERFRREKGWDLREMPSAAEFIIRYPTNYFQLYDAVGWVAFAWQVRAHSNDLVLTRDDYKKYLARL